MKKLLTIVTAVWTILAVSSSSNSAVAQQVEVSCEDAANEIYDYYIDEEYGHDYAYAKAMNYLITCEILN
ncbi:hypothetical protein [Parapedobacter sp. DT-150]|uniref:hypothetical protein n=1 Tax=Parapedobacter sp. DT-150 TaxID=3396162 RepID=UPI003F19BD38